MFEIFESNLSKGDLRIFTVISSLSSNWTPCELGSNFEIKQIWMYQEWNGSHWGRKGKIQKLFPNREDLNPSNLYPEVEKITNIFDQVRGNSSLWGKTKENGMWNKFQTLSLNPDWVSKNVRILYPSEDRFVVENLDGIVLWSDSKDQEYPYQLLEGNHRVSAWLKSDNPQPLPSVLFIGKPEKLF